MEQMTMHYVQKSNQRFGILKRKHQRVEIQDLAADIADGNALLGGFVTEISSGGFKMVRIADTFIAEMHSYTTIVSAGDRYFKLLAKPCWSRLDADSHSQEIGFKIVDASWEWTEFVLNTASDVDYEDDWGYQA